MMTETEHLRILALQIGKMYADAGNTPAVKISIIGMGEMNMATGAITLSETSSMDRTEPELLEAFTVEG